MQILLVELRGDQLSGGVTLEPTALLRNRRSDGRVSETNHKKWNSLLLELCNHAGTVAGKFVSIREDHNRPVAAGRRFEGFHRFGKSDFHIGPAKRDRVRIQFVDVLVEGNLVRSQRTGEIRGPRKRNQSEPVIPLPLHQPAQQKFRMFQPGWRQIGRLHAFGNIEKHQQIPAVRFVRHQLRVPERTRSRPDQKQHGQQQQSISNSPPPPGKFDGHFSGITAAEQLLQPRPPFAGRVVHQHSGRTERNRYQNKNIRMNKVHRSASSLPHNYSVAGI